MSNALAAIEKLGLENIVIVDVRLGAFGKANHCLQRFDGVFSRRCLAGEHYRACAVVDGICNVSGFRTGRTRIVYHRFEHLCSSNYRLVAAINLIDEPLLDDRHLLKRYLNSEIAAGNHNTVCDLKYLIEVVQALHILDFGDYFHLLSAVPVKEHTDFFNVIRSARK